MQDILLADIGATNCRFATIGPDGRPHRMLKLRGDAVPSLEAGIARYLDESGLRPRAAVLAIAALFEGDEISMTNRPWRFRLSELAKHFGWEWVRGLNDFEAAASSLPLLREADTRVLGPVSASEGHAKAIFGPGTGLGVAGVVQLAGRWTVLPSEGGHASFGPAQDDEIEVFARLRSECGFVSVERVLSGPGLERLHRAMHPGASATAAAIVDAAHAGDESALATAAMFVRLIARYAGDIALTFKALGGVYIGGGVARRMAPSIDEAAFRAAFERHPPYEHLLRRVGTTLITLDEPGLLGCAAVARTMRAAG